MKPSTIAPALLAAYRCLLDGVAAMNYLVRLSLCNLRSGQRTGRPPRWLFVLGFGLFGIPACLGMISESQAAARGGGAMPALASGYPLPSLVNAGTVGADGRWNGAVNVVVAVPMDKVPLMDSWWCMGHSTTGPLQSPTWVKVFHDQVLVGQFSK